ncbi:MAG: S41 family peptidase [Bacteroidales bacterium]|nr:S41 family peptidase [Bacteroidales bacterium]
MKTSHVALIISVALTIGVLLGVWLSPVSKNEAVFDQHTTRTIEQSTKLNSILQVILENYVDTISVEQLEDNAIRSLLDNLDPHSAYISKMEFKSERETITGLFEGIGITFRIEDDSVYVIQVLDGGPAEKVGMLNGDRIITINDTNVSGIGININDIPKKLKGPKGTMVKVGVKREGVSELLNFDIRRDVILTHSVSYSGMLDDEIGYIHLTTFSATTYKEVYNAIRDLKSQGMKKLIFDLRDNGGGLLHQAINVVDMFLPTNQLIVYTEGRNEPRSESYSRAGGLFEKGDLVVMINETSASASEIVAGAIQDNDRGTIVGRRSFGKGLVQEQFEMVDGSAFRLTVSRYYTPSGRCIQRPYDKGTDEYYQEFLSRVMMDMMADSLIQEITDTTKYYTREGRVVYGGGGIYPDVILPYERDTLLIYYNKVLQKGLLYKYAFDYTEKNRTTLISKYPNSDYFVTNFVVTNTMFEDFVANTIKKGIKRDNKSLKVYGDEMRTLLKAYIGELLYGKNTFYEVYLSIDKELQKTIDIIKK